MRQRLENRAIRLARAQHVAPGAQRGASLLKRLGRIESILKESYGRFTGMSEVQLALSYAAEWMLDNFYIVEQAIRQIREDMPKGYYRQLPKLANTSLRGYPRVYGLGRAIVNKCGSQLDLDRVMRFVRSYQEVQSLTMGETWAVPTMLRLSCLESLAKAVANITGLGDREQALLDDAGITLPEELEDDAVVANGILTLRMLATQDWKAFFESVSCVERVLSEDPAGVYASVDFDTRDHYRKVVERLAWATGDNEEAIAREVVALARESLGQGDHGVGVTELRSVSRRGHVGFYLVDAGLKQLEARLGYRPPLGKLISRWMLSHPTLIYLGSILGLSLVTTVGLGVYAQWAAGSGVGLALRLLLTLGVGLLVLLPASAIAVGLVNWAVTNTVPPRLLPRMDFDDGIPTGCETMVVIPALMADEGEVASLLRQLELHYLGNPDPRLYFGLLVDLTDAPKKHMPGDEALVEQAKAGIEALNQKYRGQHGGEPFYLFYRQRDLNPWEDCLVGEEGEQEVASECWMGWERKRGKLAEFNAMLQGKDDPFVEKVGRLDVLEGIQYVITLDADTLLPRGDARRLVATLAHPLNRAQFDPRSGVVVAGYTVLQPRVEIKPASAGQSVFSRLFSGDVGLDLYTRAVSDVYQDFFGEGIYAGKGIYDVDAFERSLTGRVPENHLLSHDLFEGIHGRAGLIADVVLYEEYPSHYLAYTRRMHRWVRGDWQLLPWLRGQVPAEDGGRLPNKLSVIDRWKIIDNLRRSLLRPALILLLLAGWLGLPGSPIVWTGVSLLALGMPLLTGFVGLATQMPAGGARVSAALRAWWLDFVRWLLAVVFLLYESSISIDAIATTLHRMFVSRKRLLQWTTSAHTLRLFGRQTKLAVVWRRMGAIPFVALGFSWLVAALNVQVQSVTFLVAAPVLLAWVVSPYIAYWISLPLKRQPATLSAEQLRRIRCLARRTWLYFERFVGPEDQWLPPDHFQEDPRGIVAHRTSPTNMGLAMLSALVAYDLGYTGPLDLVLRLRPTFETMSKLERYRGHFLNWYDTGGLRPLPPRYVSVVDSGNLAACLLVVKQACEEMSSASVFRWERWEGLLDTVEILLEIVDALGRREGAIWGLRDFLVSVRKRVKEARPEDWPVLLRQLGKQTWPELERLLISLVEVDSSPNLDSGVLNELRIWSERINYQLFSMQSEMDMLVPWALPLSEPPAIFVHFDSMKDLFDAWREVLNVLADFLGYEGSQNVDLAREKLGRVMVCLQDRLETAGRTGLRRRWLAEALSWCQRVSHALSVSKDAARTLVGNPPTIFTHFDWAMDLLEGWQSLADSLPVAPRLEQVPGVCNWGKKQLYHLVDVLNTQNGGLDIDGRLGQWLEEARAWCLNLATELDAASMAVKSLLIGFQDLAVQAESGFVDMDFGFLFDEQRRVFHIGYNVDAGALDDNYYDLLASEARIASLLAIAKGDVPESHWVYLARPITQVDGSRVLLSWSGTMFEYLMPILLFRRYDGTLLEHSAYNAVAYQIAYGRRRGVPWGISESGYYRFDAGMHYQYRAFGVPGLGFKRGLGEDLVVAPYASLLALPLRPRDVMKNVDDLLKADMLGTYGFYESVDYTRSRLPSNQRKGIVRSYMVHHQGMILLSLGNYLLNDIMVGRFQRDPRVQSVQLLLQEQVPRQAPVQRPHPEDVRAVRPLQPVVTAIPWRVTPVTPAPQVHVLSNGRYSLVVSNAGGGYSTWEDKALTRWQADSTLDDWGTWLYIKDRESDRLWSAGCRPTGCVPENQEVLFFPDRVEFSRRDEDIALRMDIVIAPDNDVEIRRMSMTNLSDRTRSLTVCSYGEVVLTEPAADRRHPAFSKLFVESEFVSEVDGMFFRRRPRTDEEVPLYLLHSVVVNGEQDLLLGYEGDRGQFIGRGGTARSPAALSGEGQGADGLSGTVGATLDPVMALAVDVDLKPHATAEIAYVTIAGEDRDDILNLARRYRDWPRIERVFPRAQSRGEMDLHRLGLDSAGVERAQQLLSVLLYPHAALRASSGTLAGNTGGQPGLWAYGISGDYPILLVSVEEAEELDLLRLLLQAHAYWRERQIEIDLVVMNERESGYDQELQGQIYRLLSRTGSDAWLNQRGGVFILQSAQMSEADRTLLETAARVVLRGDAGPVAKQMQPLFRHVVRLPQFVPALVDPSGFEQTPPVERPTDLLFDNGFGGFSPNGREYVVYLDDDQWTPAPWINVIANPAFGFMVSAAGSMCTWAVNSGENRLTPWHNDPVSNPAGEAIYLRDEETAEVWTPTRLPAGSGFACLARHGAGYSTFESNNHGLEHVLTVFTVPDAPLKIARLQLRDVRQRQRRLTVTYYAEWVLGTTRDVTQQYVVPEFYAPGNALLARNTYNQEFGSRVAFLAASQSPHSLTADRTEFLGRQGSLANPAALGRIGLSGRVEAGLDPCAAVQIHVDLQPGETQEVYFLLGQGASRQESLDLIAQYLEPDQVETAWRAVDTLWEGLLDTVTVETPEPAMDLLVNRWLLYQALSCRIWGRSALYQSSGAFGFRDQLQDVLALMPVAPEIAREHILRSAAHQFEAGDVLHWWHPPSGRGVRTRCSDDLLWLPFVTAQYVSTTGDVSILDEQVPFLLGDPLADDEMERYGHYGRSTETASLYVHCRRALDRGATSSYRGLPLIGSHDWNDGYSQVGVKGKGESVWLGWFLHVTLTRFASLCDRLGDHTVAETYRQQAEAYREALEAHAWDGSWYRRAYYDDGTPLGSAENQECKIDSLAQSWAVLSAVADPVRAGQAMDAVLEHLVREEDSLILLFTPPFDETPHNPGYIKGYLPGIRENGGQYTHAAAWVIWAFAEMGDGDRAAGLFRLINPIQDTDTPENACRYYVEPYVSTADVYSVEPHVGRGGWTWYTGSGGWLYRVALEKILGLRRQGGALLVDPCIPRTWAGFEITYRMEETAYVIQVRNPAGVNRGVARITLDGEPVSGGRIPIVDDGRRHVAVVEMGQDGDA